MKTVSRTLGRKYSENRLKRFRETIKRLKAEGHKFGVPPDPRTRFETRVCELPSCGAKFIFRIHPKPTPDLPRAPLLAAPRVCPKDPTPHIKHAISVVRELLAAAPDDAFATRYKRWLNIMEDDLHDAPDITDSFRGSVDHFQRQPLARSR